MILGPRLFLKAAAGIHGIRLCDTDGRSDIVCVESASQDDAPISSSGLTQAPVKGPPGTPRLTCYIGIQQEGSYNVAICGAALQTGLILYPDSLDSPMSEPAAVAGSLLSMKLKQIEMAKGSGGCHPFWVLLFELFFCLCPSRLVCRFELW